MMTAMSADTVDPVAADVAARMRAHLGGDPGRIGTEQRTASAAPLVTLPDADEPAVSVVIVTYGTGPVVIDCLAALAATTAGTPVEAIVVDQPPPPGRERALPAAARLRLVTAGVRLVHAPANFGFGGGNALGVARARGERIVLLNPDAVVQDGWLEPLLAVLDDPTVGIAAPVLLNPDGSVQEAGQTLVGADTAPVLDEPAAPVTDVTYSSAACWALRRADWERIGGFDPAYHPAYFEDVDLALRARRLGLRAVVVAASRVVHHRGTSTGEAPRPAFAQQAVFRRRWGVSAQ